MEEGRQCLKSRRTKGGEEGRQRSKEVRDEVYCSSQESAEK